MCKTAVIGDNILPALVAILLLLSGCSKAGNHAEARKFMAGAKGRFIQVCLVPDYLVEVVIDSKGAVRLYTLTHKDSRVIDVKIQTLKGFAKATGDLDSREITLEPSPQEGDRPGRTSHFVGKLPDELSGRSLFVTIPNLSIDGERFQVRFVATDKDITTPVSHGDPAAMPAKAPPEKEKELYLTPEGRYTAADIAANGNVTASQKFQGIKSEHNMNPKVGDQLCPISGTKANQKFSWIIAGKAYTFCCPPCIDEFLASAKASKDPLPAPASFIKK